MLNWQLTSTLCIMMLLTGCGRRQRTIFLFPTEKVVRFATLQFPSAKITAVTRSTQGIAIEWIKVPESLSINNATAQCIGYNVYSLTHKGFIPKNPLNTNPITTTRYLDTTKNSSHHYMVRALFLANKKVYEGPSSNIGYFSQ